MIYIWTDAGDRAALERLVLAPMQAANVGVRVVPPGLVPPAGAGDVVLALGSRFVPVFARWGAVPKNRSLGSLRGRRFAGKAASILLSWDPGIVANEPDKGPELRWDARLAVRLHETGTTAPCGGEYEWAEDLSELIEYVRARHDETGRPTLVAVDLETDGLFPWVPGKEIVTSQWTAWPGRALVLDHRDEPRLNETQREQISWLLTTPKVKTIGANLKFDEGWIFTRWGMAAENFTFEALIAASLLDENRSNSLNALVKEYAPSLGGYDDTFNATADKGDMRGELAKRPNEFLTYAGGDVDGLLRAAGPLRRRLAADPQLARFFQVISMPAARTFSRVERRGVVVDLARYEELERDVRGRIRELTAAAFAEIPVRIKARHADNLKLTRKGLIVDYLFTADGCALKPLELTAKAPILRDQRDQPAESPAGFVARRMAGGEEWKKYVSTSIDEHLSQFAKNSRAGRFVGLLAEIGKLGKVASTYIGTRDKDGQFVKGFLSHLRPDGRLHPTYVLYAGALYDNDDRTGGTVTGRLSAKDPAIQTLMKHGPLAKRLRRCYTAPPGMLRWQVDFSQGELRVAACLADERVMIDAYRRGIDTHAKTGASMLGVPLDEFLRWKDSGHPKHELYEETRQKAKAVNFGFLYGMGYPKFVRYAWKSYGAVFTSDEARAVRDGFFATYPGLSSWHERQRELVHVQGYVRGPLGRIRHLPQVRSRFGDVVARAERRAINSPVQSTLSDLALWAAARVDEEFRGHEDEFCVAGSTHDALDGYGKEDSIERHLKVAAEIAGGLPIRRVFGWDHQVDFPVDAELGPSLGELVKLPA